ncbi:hypothetical protein K438DRAFT_1773548 [Mycena galopus ATCC 62051]|nr:hypothetical protein K438DRAFT_1773548 [Mycena galopus ATCC 62051]
MLDGVIGKLEHLLVSDDVRVHVEKTMPKKRNQKAVQKPSKDLQNHIHVVLRRATYEKFNVQQASDFVIYNPADKAKVTACEEGLADPADDLFQWDFNPGFIHSHWNDLMTEKVVAAALEADGEYEDIAEGSIERDYLESVMTDKLKGYRGPWKGFQPRFNDSLGRVETVREARDHGMQVYEQHQLSCRSTTTKARKFEEHVTTTTATIEIKKAEGIAGDIETWERLLEIINHLGPQGMSSKEEDEVEADDTKIFIYQVKLCVWREPHVVEYLRFVDAQMALFKKHQRGPTPATRVRGRTPVSSKAACGLPKSLYNREWLKKKTPAYLKELKISKEAFGLFVAVTERMAL